MRNKAPKQDDSQRYDNKAWSDLFKHLFYESDSSTADHTAKLLNYMLLELDKGPKGIDNAASCIEDALRLLFPFTSVGRTCWILFLVSLDPDFPAKPDSSAVLSEAMKLAKAALERGPVSEQKQRRKRSRRQNKVRTDTVP